MSETVPGHAEMVEEGLGILTNLMDNIQRKGNYSAESTVFFLDQIGQCLRAALATPHPEASDAPDIVPVADGIWPATLVLRDTTILADEGQRIFTTATGHGYEKREYARADALAALRAELAAVKRERDEWRESATEFRGLCSEWQTQADTAEAEVARLKDENKELVAGLEFLLDRLDDYEPEMEARDYFGHVCPAKERARSLTATKGG